jgi:hypothetical protein
MSPPDALKGDQMTVVGRGTTDVITPRTTPGPAHQVATAVTAPRQRDGDTFEVPQRRASQTGPAGSLRTAIAFDDSDEQRT